MVKFRVAHSWGIFFGWENTRSVWMCTLPAIENGSHRDVDGVYCVATWNITPPSNRGRHCQDDKYKRIRYDDEREHFAVIDTESDTVLNRALQMRLQASKSN
ncbi:hypothetical protein CEXT_522161 [Caerostris extrusa]|uniref:Uncharacterized protein n=1 Tax=Caerostris extrusa TaxID=172846 RepID=A0AAV4S0K4_CAEEX|nr:hypothetical protein CEXT_522161 [Caerostris extrusa]